MTDAPLYIEVAVSLPVPETYSYEVPKKLSGLIVPGKRVLCPFGQRLITGYILRPCKKPDHIKTREIHDIIDEEPLFTEDMIPFFSWIADYYLYPIGEVIKAALPGGINISDHCLFEITLEGKTARQENRTSPLESKIMDVLCCGPASHKKICRELKQDISYSTLHQLKTNSYIHPQRKIKTAQTRMKFEKYITAQPSNFPTDQLTAKKSAIFSTIREYTEISLTELKKIHPTVSSHLQEIANSGCISIEEKQIYRDPFGKAIERDTPPELKEEQQKAVDIVTNAIGKGFNSFLLFGVTGSGKTEVYMNICSQTLLKGLTAIVLVPEIALISQTERRFRARFGDKIAVIHSGLSAGEKYDQWLKIIRKETPIVIGARSAIFAPLEKIGVIIVDEEHDASYKQESSLRYNARDLAVVRAKQIDGVAVLGSATPSVQSFYNVQAKKFNLITLKNRINENPLPHIHIIDLKQLKDERGVNRFISPLLYEAIKRTLSQKEQVLLFLNRRGFANFPVCATCGETLKCPNCDVSLTLHKKINAYRCHFCGFSMASVSNCRICGSTNIKIIGLGTERIEEAVTALFPEATVARMDQDTTAKKGSVLKILKNLNDKKTDILIGTQMVAKGHDFPGITLVGIICADLSLNFPDFRSSEKTFQLLAQVAGRAGRGEKKGRVILQTYAPEHFSINAAQHQDFISFYNQEISFRKGLTYPPFSRIIQLTISGKDIQNTKKFAAETGDLLVKLNLSADNSYPIHILGPIESTIYKLANRYRWQILLKSPYVSALQKLVKAFQSSNIFRRPPSDIKVTIDVDPYSMI